MGAKAGSSASSLQVLIPFHSRRRSLHIKVKRTLDKRKLSRAESSLAPTSRSLEHLTGKGQEPRLTYHSLRAVAGPDLPALSQGASVLHLYQNKPPLSSHSHAPGSGSRCGAARAG